MARLAQAPEHRRREGRDREPRAPAAHAARLRRGILPALRRGSHRRSPSWPPAGVGCISVTGNVAPRLLSEMHSNWQDGRVPRRWRIQNRLVPLHDALFSRDQPRPGEIRREPARPHQRAMPAAAGAVRRCHQGEGARRDDRGRAAELNPDGGGEAEGQEKPDHARGCRAKPQGSLRLRDQGNRRSRRGPEGSRGEEPAQRPRRARPTPGPASGKASFSCSTPTSPNTRAACCPASSRARRASCW